jgi:anti-sigma factor RsiW
MPTVTTPAPSRSGRLGIPQHAAGSGEATLRCIALVELVTAYLGGELDAQTRARVDQHLRTCAGCVQYVEQMRVTACTVGKIRDEQLDPAFRDRLLGAFRDWN